MDLVELGSVLGEFFEGGGGPSHSELDVAFARTQTADFDPAPGGTTLRGTPLGKAKRVRQALVYAGDRNSTNGMKFATQIIALLRASGSFASSGSDHESADRVARLRGALSRLGMVLHADGTLSPLVVDNLGGTELTEALQTIVRRLNANPGDPELLVGVGKDLDEATARHVLNERMGGYETRGSGSSFPVTLAGAFTATGLSLPPTVKLDEDPHRAVQQALFILGVQVNRLRNEVGTGHGHPNESRKTVPLSAAEARLVARSTALVAGALLDRL
jgi:hypothetical protein